VETDIEVEELEKSIGDAISFHSNSKGVSSAHPSVEVSKDSISIRDPSPAGSRTLDKTVTKKEISVTNTPKSPIAARKHDFRNIHPLGSSVHQHDSKKELDRRS
jgi:hypothetical protein